MSEGPLSENQFKDNSRGSLRALLQIVADVLRLSLILFFQPLRLATALADLRHPKQVVFVCRFFIVPFSVVVVTLLVDRLSGGLFESVNCAVTSAMFGASIALGASISGGYLSDHLVERYLALHGSIGPAVIGGVGYAFAGPESLQEVFAKTEAGFYGFAACLMFGLVGTLKLLLAMESAQKQPYLMGRRLYVVIVSTGLSLLPTLALFLASWKLINLPQRVALDRSLRGDIVRADRECSIPVQKPP